MFGGHCLLQPTPIKTVHISRQYLSHLPCEQAHYLNKIISNFFPVSSGLLVKAVICKECYGCPCRY